MCNQAKPCSTDRERVTEQVVTNWFQNKRKFAKKDYSLTKALHTLSDSNRGDSSSINFDFLNNYDDNNSADEDTTTDDLQTK